MTDPVHFRLNVEKLGGHVHVHIHAGTELQRDNEARPKLGHLIMDPDHWAAFRLLLGVLDRPHIEVTSGNLAERFMALRLSDLETHVAHKAYLAAIHAAVAHGAGFPALGEAPEPGSCNVGLAVCIHAAVDHLLDPFRNQLQSHVIDSAKHVGCACGVEPEDFERQVRRLAEMGAIWPGPDGVMTRISPTIFEEEPDGIDP